MSAPEFTLTDGGPIDRTLTRAVPSRLVRALALVALAWVPLLVMALAIARPGPEPAVTFFEDLSTHVRFLFVAPLLILAEAKIGARTRMVIEGFLGSGLVKAEQRDRFHDAIARVSRLANSAWIEVGLVVVTALLAGAAVQRLSADGIVFWFEESGPRGEHLSAPGIWYVLVSPIVVFLFVRWAFRYLLWCWLLHRVSRLDLDLVGTHPDKAGGLGFVNIGQSAFASIAFASSCVVSAAAGTELLQGVVTLKAIQTPLIAFVALSVVIGLLPLPAFAGPLTRTKRAGLIAYAGLATRYVQSFERKWLQGPPPEEPILGSGDVQSLADLGASFDRLEAMRPTPLDKRTIVAFAAASAIPLLPLALTVMPLKDILKMLLQAVA